MSALQVKIGKGEVIFAAIVSFSTVFAGWIYLQSVALICYSFLGFTMIGNIGFWSVTIPVVQRLGKLTSFNGKSLLSTSLLGISLMTLNQFLVYGLVVVLFDTVYGCESTYSFLQTLQINHFLPHVVAYTIILAYVNRSFLASKFMPGQQIEPTQAENYLWLKQNGESIRLEVAAIQAIKADNNAIFIHTKDRRYVSYQSLTSFLEQVKSPEIIRVHKSHAVHVKAVERFRPKPSGDGIVVLEGGFELRVSRNFKQSLTAKIGS